MAARTSAAPGTAVSTALKLVVTRVFDAPRPQVFEAWSGPEHVLRWWGPRGFRAPAGKIGVGAGGAWRVAMRSPDGGLRRLRCAWREIAAPERLVFVNSFSDPEGGLTRAPFEGSWPLEMLSTLTFAEEADGGTRVTVRWDPIDASEAERATFEAGRASMTQGWTGSFEVLEAYLAELE
jgi:uncharacterized protein YndB with AHSA1/START domain